MEVTKLEDLIFSPVSKLGRQLVSIFKGHEKHTDDESEDGIVLKGNITLVDGEPLAGATVLIGDKFSLTDAKGHYRIAGIRPGEHTVTVTKTGYEIACSNMVIEDFGIFIRTSQLTGQPDHGLGRTHFHREIYFPMYTFIDNHTGWAVGLAGTVLHTRDGGNIWVSQDSQTAKDLMAVYFINSCQQWMDSRNRWRTAMPLRNGGRKWHVVDTIYMICFTASTSQMKIMAG
jgi:hypothetical protein